MVFPQPNPAGGYFRFGNQKSVAFAGSDHDSCDRLSRTTRALFAVNTFSPNRVSPASPTHRPYAGNAGHLLKPPTGSIPSRDGSVGFFLIPMQSTLL